jgi:glyoxylase-like metal-dependent hydrolase (beta-lactamase superfamily II)
MKKLLLILFSISTFTITSSHAEDLASFCKRLPRAAYASFEKHSASSDWFEVYEVEPGIFAIYEPFQWQEVISYLITGTDKALLFDTGNGFSNIKAIIDQLTNLPVMVLNSHTHFDHIGSNHAFKAIKSPSTPFSIKNSQGWGNDYMRSEAAPEALCKGLPDGVTQDNHHIKSFTISAKVIEGDIIDLGGRKLEVMQIPGHTPDSVALLDADKGHLWTGDSFYEGPIWLFFPETDLPAYKKSIARIAALAPNLKAVFPAHNTPKADPNMLPKVRDAFDQVLAGKAKSVPLFEGTVTYEFDGFGFLMLDKKKKRK